VILVATRCLVYHILVRMRVRLGRAVAVTTVSMSVSLFASDYVRGSYQACNINLAFKVSIRPSIEAPAVRQRAEARY
jgi:hypothetical protein